MATIITRHGYCPLCALSGSPKTGQKFLAHGSTKNRYKVLEADHNGMIGFVPITYKLEKVLGDNVVILKSCSMFGCGCDRRIEDNQWFYFIKNWTREIWDLKTWNALVLYKNDNDYEI